MVFSKTAYRCSECGHSTPKWFGKCPGCGAWNTMFEERVKKKRGDRPSSSFLSEARAVPLHEIPLDSSPRKKTSIGELDRVLGGGVVEGAAVLVGGDPGIGKSTLMLQAAQNMAGGGLKVLYVTGEESARQTKMRASRLGVDADLIYLMAETNLEAVLAQAERVKPFSLIIDSIQTMSADGVEGAPGSLSQVRETAAALVRLAKTTGAAVFLVGHVTKSGAIAGPRAIEHQVDTVLYFEGEAGGAFRVLRSIKNRFGSTNEIGIFEMTAAGLAEVANPSEMFLEHRSRAAPGTAVTPCIEGSRPILVEVQALVGANTYGTPQRAAMGIDRGRLAILTAVLERRAGLSLADRDVFLNVAGGLRITEPAADMAAAAAMASALFDRPNHPETIFFGEIGLAGEVRAVANPEARINEGAKLGFKRCILPAASAGKLHVKPKLELIPVETVAEALEAART